ncbi:DUF922 domain-containing Zn-dependent protease [Chelativorans sp. YIM 93263]|uniref:DUF922 domain-containing Zn-dependent protease n=1 Tax=Chelativorans sp. YIM 93263 TaxID=2906648 RepID=UPI00237844A1|nr:DUF922 domain-containing protein [Chelativorans sp. YIM 93263]
MKAALRLALFAACFLPFPVAAQAEWEPVETVETYAVSGETGIALYESIGERGPKVGIGRAIAYTDFKLTWTRDYQPRGGGCTLASARPKLIITYRLPELAGDLPPAMQKRWDKFIDGVAAHERVHGEIITDIARKIEAMSVGLTMADDPDCAKTRAELQRRLVPIAAELKQRNRAFDREEMSEGGNVHRLVLELVNGG